MAEQAENLRKWTREQSEHQQSPLHSTRLIAVASGKGGVGKSNITLNLALALQGMGRRIGIIDADLGFSNLEILLGMRPRFSLQDVFAGRTTLRAGFTVSDQGVALISGGSGTQPQDAEVTVFLSRFAQQLVDVDGELDLLFIDFGAGFGKYTEELMGLCEEMLLITTPEPTSLTDAYALVKMMCQAGQMPSMRLIVNRAQSTGQAREASQKFASVCSRFLQMELTQLGSVLEDDAVVRAVARQLPFYLAEPGSSASRSIRRLAEKTLQLQDPSIDGTSANADKVGSPLRGIQALFERFVKRVR